MKQYLVLFISLTLSVSLLAVSKKNIKAIHEPEKSIAVDFNSEKGVFKNIPHQCIGAGRASEGLRSDWQEQLSFVKKNCDFKYIRMHGLLSDEMGVYQEDSNGNPIYNFQYVDVLHDYLLSIGIKPFVELSFMPKALASGDATVFWWKANVSPPNSISKWENLIKELVKHFVQRYGHDEVKTWYFEVWNEPNLKEFFTGSMNDYFNLYAVTAKAVKSVSEEYRVGGPATAGAQWISEFIDYCYKNKAPVDFVSGHDYGIKNGFLDVFGKQTLVINKKWDSILRNVSMANKQVSTSAIPNLEIHFTEWNSSWSAYDPIHDHYQQASYILQKSKQVGNLLNSMSYWVFTDVFEEGGPRAKPFHGGFGLLNLQGIPKPAFFAYKYLNSLGNIELTNNDTSSWVCKDKEGNIQILLWDFTTTHPGDSVPNQIYYSRDIVSKFKTNVSVEILNVPAGNYILEVYSTGYRQNDVLSAYTDIGKPQNLTKTQVDKLRVFTNDNPVQKSIEQIKNDVKFKTTIKLRDNDIYLLKLTKL